MISGIIALLLGIFGAVIKSPITQKVALFGAFFGLLTLAMSQVKSYLFPYLQSLGGLSQNISFIMCKIDFIGALNMYISSLLAIFVIKQVLGFIKG